MIATSFTLTSSRSNAFTQDSLRAGPLLSPALSPAITPNTSAIQARVRATTPGEVALDATGGWKKSNEKVVCFDSALICFQTLNQTAFSMIPFTSNNFS